MRILLPTGRITYSIVKSAAAGLDADVIVTGEIASFLTPSQLKDLLQGTHYDMVLVSGMSTASFAAVEKETGIPVFRGPRHAADLALVLPLLDSITLSRDTPADDFIAGMRKKEAYITLDFAEQEANFRYLIRGVKIGGDARIKVLAEIMDAHRVDGIREKVREYLASGADIVDLGFGFDATPEEVRRVFADLEGIDAPLAVDSQDPNLIEAALPRADLVLSLQEENMDRAGRAVADAGAGAVVVPGRAGLEHTITLAEKAGIEVILADPLLQPAGSGLLESLRCMKEYGYPLFFGAGNVVELFDADSVGMNALLAGLAMEAGAAVIFTSEHSDKTRGAVEEMRRATEMMALSRNRPYPKDLGVDLLVIKEKRRRREPPVTYRQVDPASPMPRDIVYDPRGNFRIGVADGQIVAELDGKAIRGDTWSDVFYTILARGNVSLLDHAAYLGKELYKAELAIRFGRSFEQDGPF
ncbi:dihydropteroate synthase-like protein [Methanolinea mesophila]|uniref:dihydropteroate synthase-like protein n=1 Tax=Methanolinea mesophila TaxID=547055 RepID=UPI001AE61CB3|nr:dihydropteroate synthase-like protein [Methanolinea mesophila]MBP1928658.1 dihydropteroate synthase-like protein [Methanolinea mesophila]